MNTTTKHPAVTPSEPQAEEWKYLEARPDLEIFAYARAEGRCILTYNTDDLQALLLADLESPGVLGVFRDRDRRKDMVLPEIVRAIANVEASGWESPSASTREVTRMTTSEKKPLRSSRSGFSSC